MAKLPEKDQDCLYVQGFKGGLAIAWFCAPNKDQEPNMLMDMVELIEEEPVLCKKLGIFSLYVRRGKDGNTPLTWYGTNSATSFLHARSTDSFWKVIPMKLGDLNTPAGRMEAAMMLITYFNIKANLRKIRFGEDLTTTPMAKMDTALLDIHVYFAMIHLNLRIFVGQCTDDHEFMSTYWTDVAHGAKFIDKF